MPTRSKPIVSWMSMRLRDGDLGADAVGRGGQQRLRRSAVSARGVEQPGEPAEPAEDLGPRVLATHSFISSTARSPASMSTPAAA